MIQPVPNWFLDSLREKRNRYRHAAWTDTVLLAKANLLDNLIKEAEAADKINNDNGPS